MSSAPKPVATDAAPAAIGPYSQAMVAGGFAFLSGQIALDPATGALIDGGVEAQTDQVMANLKAVITAAGGTVAGIVKTTIYLVDMNDFAVVNARYAAALGDHRPARATVEVSRLPKDVRVEIDAVVCL